MGGEKGATASGRRRVYLAMASVDEARGRVEQALAALPRLAEERVPVREALGRVTAGPVLAPASSPHYSASAMDGYALRSDLTAAATEASPVRLRVPDEARPVNTGEPLPEGLDAVAMIEDVLELGGKEIELLAAVAPWQNVRLLGEDMVASELAVPAGRRIGAVELGALVAAQVREVSVVRRPRVAILPTGTEVVVGDAAPAVGQVVDYDSPMLAALVEEWGGVAEVRPPTPDDPTALRAALLEAARSADLVAAIAGSSAGTADHVPNLIEGLGELVVHGLRLSPGKPAALGLVEGTPVIGVPGYSVAAWTAFDLLAKPIVHHLLGEVTPGRPRVEAVVRRKVPSRSGSLELLRVALGRVGGVLVAVPLKRGSGAVSSLVQADGLAEVPEMAEGLDPGSTVRVELLRPMAEVERTVLVVGSHDIALDLLASHLQRRPARVRLASAHVGSMGGLRAIAAGEAHLAGVHLLDPTDGSYNVSYVRRVLGDRPVALVNLVHREVGLMVRRGNPKGIASVRDLARDDVVMINRQRGAGTRVLLDHLLGQEGLDGTALKGYGREVTTHTMVAAAVAGGAADAGLGIRAAAEALGVGFVPVTTERYDLAIPAEHRDHPGVREVLAVVGDEAYRAAVLALGGYDLRDAGRVLLES